MHPPSNKESKLPATLSLHAIEKLMSQSHEGYPSDYRREAFTLTHPSTLRQAVDDERPLPTNVFGRVRFEARSSAQWKATKAVSKLQKAEFRKLKKVVYVDYGGSGQPMDSVVKKSSQFLRKHVMGNTHSENPSAKLSSDQDRNVRLTIRRFFTTTPEVHDVIFTSGTSAALRLLADAYFNKVKVDRVKTTLVLTDDSHNAVNGMRTIVYEKGLEDLVSVVFIPVDIVTLRIDDQRYSDTIDSLLPDERGLVVLTAQSNLSGVKHDFGRHLTNAKAKGWDTALDAAALLATSPLDLCQHPEIDFLPCSWYKVLGYPTGIGSLIVRQDAMGKLRKDHFSGGTVDYVHNGQLDQFRLLNGHSRFEDGTLNFQSFVALDMGLERILSAGPHFRDDVRIRVRILASWLVDHLPPIRWPSTSHPVVRIVGFPSKSLTNHGGTLALVFYDALGGKIPFDVVEREAMRRNIHLRFGCMCNYVARLANPGDDGFPEALGPDAISRVDWKYDLGERCWVLCEKDLEKEALTETGVVRISLGMPSRFEDVYGVWRFVKDFSDGHISWT